MDIWFTILFGYNNTEKELWENTNWWYKDHNSGIFNLPIQAPNTVQYIWLFLSHKRINLAKLKEAICKEAQKRSINQVPFALMFSNVNNGKRFDASIRSKNKQAKAIAVKVAQEHSLLPQDMFSDLYGSKANSFPLDMWMRYVITPNPSV